MRQKRYSPSTKRNILLWSISGIIFVIVSLIAYLLYIYNVAMDNKEATFEQSKQAALNETPLTTVIDIKRFNGENAYDVVTGKTEDGDLAYAFMPIDKQLENRFILADEGITEAEMITKWKQNCSNCELKKITPGIVKNNFIWEIIYTTEEDKYVFAYYLFSNGNLYEQLK
jgi:uncharacterized protein YpmB